jgi:dihydroorotate dehydrogenase (fumarate)
MADLRSGYLGLELRGPLVASASPLTGQLETLRRLEAAGAAAVVLPSLFEEQVTHDQLEVERVLETGAESFPEALSYFPELEDYNTGPDAYLRLIERAKAALSVPVIASLNGRTTGGWLKHARLIEEAGADALELNVYRIAADPGVSGAEIERDYVELVAAVREAIALPLAVKIGPFFSALANAAVALADAGADGLVLFNRFYQPDLDLETLDVRPHLVLSTSAELRLPLRWIAILHGRVTASLAATTGIHTAEDAAKALLAGADVAMMTSALLQNGPEHLATVESELSRWLDEHEYESLDQLRGSVSRDAATDPEAFERANYMRELVSYSNEFRAH